MRNYSIVSGNFSANGNFSGYTALGERLFIHKTQMNSLGFSKESDKPVSFPFYAIGATKQIGQLDENGKAKVNVDGTPLTVDRLQALSIFGSKESLTNAHVDTATLDIEIASAIKSQASAKGLSETAINKLMELA